MGDDHQSVVISMHPDPNTKEAIEFYRWLGTCVATWAFIDRRLYQIYHHATGLDQKESAVIYYGSRNFSRRLQLVDDAVKSFLPKPQVESQWIPLRGRAKNLSHTRNILAHHPTMRTGTSKDGSPFDIYSIYIEPYERVLNNDYPGLRGKEALETDDLKQHNVELEQLEIALCAFAWFIGGQRAASGKSVETAPDRV